MRLIILTAATLLIAAAGPVLAHTSQVDQEPHAFCEKHSKIDSDDPYSGSMTVHDSLYAQAGWWDDQKIGTDSEDGPSWACGGDPDEETMETRTSPVWLQLQDSSLGDSFRVEVTSQSGAIAGVDVFEYQEKRSGWSQEITPPCPQGLVLPDLYPGSGEPADVYLRRVLSEETVGAHQRGQSVQGQFQLSTGGERTISLTLDPADSETGSYIVAIYPQASTNLDANGPAGLDGADSISWDVFVEQGEMAVDDGEDRPELPYQANRWVFPTGHLFACVDDGVPLPPVVMGGDPPELRTPPSEDARSLLTTNLGDPA